MNTRSLIPIAALAMLLGFNEPASAQSGVSVYAVGGVGGGADLGSPRPKLYGGGGVETLNRSGFGAGVDAGAFVDDTGVVLMALSVNGVFQFRRASRGPSS